MREVSLETSPVSSNNMIQDKTNCSFESIQHTESTNLNIFRTMYFSLEEKYHLYGDKPGPLGGEPD